MAATSPSPHSRTLPRGGTERGPLEMLAKIHGGNSRTELQRREGSVTVTVLEEWDARLSVSHWPQVLLDVRYPLRGP